MDDVCFLQKFKLWAFLVIAGTPTRLSLIFNVYPDVSKYP